MSVCEQRLSSLSGFRRCRSGRLPENFNPRTSLVVCFWPHFRWSCDAIWAAHKRSIAYRRKEGIPQGSDKRTGAIQAMQASAGSRRRWQCMTYIGANAPCSGWPSSHVGKHNRLTFPSFKKRTMVLNSSALLVLLTRKLRAPSKSVVALLFKLSLHHCTRSRSASCANTASVSAPFRGKWD